VGQFERPKYANVEVGDLASENEDYGSVSKQFVNCLASNFHEESCEYECQNEKPNCHASAVGKDEVFIAALWLMIFAQLEPRPRGLFRL